MYVMTANRSLSGISCHVGIAVQRTPRVIVRKRSPSVGSDPDGVERNLKTPMVKSRGRGKRKVAASPLPSPLTPDRKSTRLNSSHTVISYAVFCLKKKTGNTSRASRALYTENSQP